MVQRRGWVQCCPKGILRICVGWFLGFYLLVWFCFPRISETLGSACARWRGAGQRPAAHGPWVPRVHQPILQGGYSLAEPHGLVCIRGKGFSKLLLLSALFPPKNGQRLPSSLRTELFLGTEQRFVVVVGLLAHIWLLSGCCSASFA